MVDRAGGEIDDLGRRRRDLDLPGRIRKAHDGVGVGDVERVADERHAERRVQILEKHRAGFGDAVAVDIAKQRDAIRARIAGPALVHEQAEEPAAYPRPVVGTNRRVAFGDQHIAVRKHVQPPRVIEIPGEGVDRRSGRRDGVILARPSHRLGDVDGRNAGGLRRGNVRRRPGDRRDGQLGRRRAGSRGRQDENGESAALDRALKELVGS